VELDQKDDVDCLLNVTKEEKKVLVMVSNRRLDSKSMISETEFVRVHENCWKSYIVKSNYDVAEWRVIHSSFQSVIF